jgi:hypothetical protein
MAKKKNVQLTLPDHAVAAHQTLFTTPKKKTGAVTAFATGGIKMPLIMQYLMDVRSWPLGILIQITGDKGCRKSSLLYHIGTWFTARHGLCDLTTTEGKMSESLLRAILGYEDEWEETVGTPYPVRANVATSMADWQTSIISTATRFNKMMDSDWTDANGNKQAGCMYIPVLIGLDSLVAQLTDKQTEAVEAQGGQDRGFATHVKAISQWISTIQAKITNRPYSLTVINHCTTTVIDQYRQPDVAPKGGTKVAYESSFVIHLNRAKMYTQHCKLPNHAPECKTTVVYARLLKTSLGDETRHIRYCIEDVYEYDKDGLPRQRTKFLWGRALVETLLSRMYAKGDSGVELGDNEISGGSSDTTKGLCEAIRESIFEVVKFKPAEKAKDTYICEKYSSEPMSGEELGAALEADLDFVRVFYKVFAIKPYDEWPIGTDYNTFIAQARKKSFADRVAVPDASEE